MRMGRERNREDSEISLTALIDVVFLLLIFFMVSATFDRTKALEMELPTAETGEGKPAGDALVLRLEEDGGYRLGIGLGVGLDGDPVPSDGLRAALEAADRDLPLIIRAHPEASSQALVHVLDVARKLALEQVSVEVIPSTPAAAGQQISPTEPRP